MSGRSRILCIVAALACGACGSSSTPTSPSTTTSTATSTTSTSTPPTVTGPVATDIDMTVTPGGSAFYSISPSKAGTLAVNIASVQASARPSPLNVPLQLGLGVPAGEGCTVTQSMEVTPALVSQLNASVTTGIYCINVADDEGVLTGPALVTLRYTTP